MSKRRPLSRRTVLQGMGASLALPWLEAMLPAAMAGEHATMHPLRMAFLYVPNGMHMPDWTPASAGTHFSLPAILQPLEQVKDHLLVLSGLVLDKGAPTATAAAIMHGPWPPF